MEIMKSGPFNLRTHQQAANLGAESITFFRGLLSGAYNFTQDELKPLADLKTTVETSAIRAIYSMETEANQTRVTIRMTVVDKEEAKKHLGTEGYKKFMAESITLEYKANEIKQTEGF